MAKNPAESARNEPAAPEGPREKPRLQQRYMRDVVPALVKDFNYQNPMQVPKLAKVSVKIPIHTSAASPTS